MLMYDAALISWSPGYWLQLDNKGRHVRQLRALPGLAVDKSESSLLCLTWKSSGLPPPWIAVAVCNPGRMLK